MGENNPQAYQIQNVSPAIASGFLINGSNDSINYLQHNGGLDYFGNIVSHNFPTHYWCFLMVLYSIVLTNKYLIFHLDGQFSLLIC